MILNPLIDLILLFLLPDSVVLALLLALHLHLISRNILQLLLDTIKLDKLRQVCLLLILSARGLEIWRISNPTLGPKRLHDWILEQLQVQLQLKLRKIQKSMYVLLLWEMHFNVILAPRIIQVSIGQVSLKRGLPLGD